MSAARSGKAWADVDEDEDSDSGDGAPKDGARFETLVDSKGIKQVIEYVERAGKTYKVTRRVKQTVLLKRTSAAMAERKTLEKFGKAATNDPKEEAFHVKQSEEVVTMELTKKVATLAVKDDVEDKFMDEALAATATLFKEKKSWAAANKDTQVKRDVAGDDRPADTAAAQLAAPAAAATGPGGKALPAAYVPPSMRGKEGGKGGKDGKGMDQNQEASLRVTNLSEDAKEGDLQMLFGKYGRLQRVHIAKDKETMISRGFAFVTYYTKQDAQRAINNLHGHGYDNLILQVSFAKPRL